MKRRNAEPAKESAIRSLLPLDELPEEKFTIVVPSKGRWDRVFVKDMLPEGTFKVLVEPHEEGLYREHNPDVEIVPHPAEVWPYSKKLQWALETYGSILSLDDDVFQVSHNEHGGKDPQCLLGKQDALGWLTRSMTEARAMGAYLVGWGDGDIRNYDPQQPYRFTGWVAASSMGILSGSKLAFNPELWVTADYWLSLLNAYHHRFCYMDWRICPGAKETFVSEGGASTTRTMDTERKEYEILVKYFGEAIGKKEATGRAKVRHEWQRTMRLPFR